MSFSKARIQRFNELASEAPPPGAYDPKFDNKVKGITIEKKERFQDGKSVTSSAGGECNSSVSSKGAAGTVPSPKFRTPQLPKKRAVKPANSSCPRAKTKLTLGTGGKVAELKYDVKHELADLKVECINKDRTIHDHANQIEEMKKETWRMDKELEELRAKQAETEEQHKKDLESMAKLQQDILDCREQRHREEMELLRQQLSEMTAAGREREIASRQRTADEETRFTNTRDEHAMLLRQNMEESDARFDEIERLRKRLAEVESEKARENEALSSVVKAKDDELTAVKTEFRQLKIDCDELRDRLTSRENDHEAEIVLRKSEESHLRVRLTESTKIRNELESKLETRQKVVFELQSQLSTVQCELDELRAEYERTSSESETRISEIINQRERNLIDLRHDFIRERERLESEKFAETCHRLELECENKELSETNAFLTEELQDVQKLYKDASRHVMEVQDELDATEKKRTEESNSHREETETMRKRHIAEQARLEELLENARLDYISELDNMTEARNKELAEIASGSEDEKRRIQERADKIVENAEAVTRETLAACRAESEERVRRVIAESDAKVTSMARETRNAVEKEMREAADRYASCLARVEDEKLELENKVHQRDAEIAKLTDAIAELKIVVENQESFSQSLQGDLDRVEAELAERKNELRTLKDQIRAESAEMVGRRRRLDVVMAENQASVAALSQQLSESNAEVERLQSIIRSGEESIKEHRGLLSAMRTTSKILTKEVYTLMEQLDANRSIVDQLEALNLAEIESVRTHIHAQIETFKENTISEITKLQDDCKKKDELNSVLKKHLDAMASKVDEAHDVLVKMEELEDARVIEISRLQLDNEKLVRELASTRDSKAQLEARETRNRIAAEEASEKNAYLTSRIEIVESNGVDKTKVQIMQEQHESRLNKEIARRRAAEEEAKKLSKDCEALRKSYQEVSDKYADMIGHHNHKQRVKHLNQLKDKILRLEKDAETRKHIIDQQTKTIEKLKAEEKRSFATRGKENLHSHGISRSPYTTPASSPLKPLTPLRDRNE